MNQPGVHKPDRGSERASRWRSIFRSFGIRHFLLPFLVFMISAVLLSVSIMHSEIQTATQRLVSQSATASRNLETQFDSMRDDFRMLVSTGAFDAYVTETSNAYWNFAMVKRFVARYQDVLGSIELELNNGDRIVLEIAPGNYLRASRKSGDQTMPEAPPSSVRHTGNLIVMQESVPVARSPGIRHVRLLVDHKRFFHYTLTNYMIGQSNLWIWSIESNDHPELIRYPQKYRNHTFQVDLKSVRKIQNTLDHGLEGVEEHEVRVPESRQVVSVFTPILLDGESMGLVFSTDRETHLGSLHRLTILLSVIFIGCFVMLITWFTVSQHRIKESERQQAEARKRAETADRAKSEFVAAMSHEIRTPLNGILGYAGLLKSSSLTAEQRDHLEVIQSSGDHLLSILNDILDLSKIASGSMSIRNEEYSPVKCAEDVIDMMTTSAEDQGLELHLELSGTIPRLVVGDPGRLSQVIYNLVGNGIKFTPKGKVSVSMAATEEDTCWRLDFSVADTGIGIPADKRDRLFAPFSQIDSSNSREYGGTGLGLAICQRLVEKMGGAIDFNSRIGVGTEFKFHINVGKVIASPKEAEKTATILVVDPDRTSLETMTSRLRGMDIRVIQAHDPASITDRMEPDKPVDLVMLAWHGNETDVVKIRRVMENHQGKTPPLIAILASRSELIVPESLFRDRISKPIRLSGLERRVSHWLSSTRHEPVIAKETPLRVLIAEDNIANSMLMVALIEQRGASTEVAVNGRETLLKLSSTAFDLIFMDVEMPGLDGIEATRRIRQGDAGENRKNIRIVGLSAHAFHEDRKVALDAGMDDYLTKPIDTDELDRVLSQACASGSGSAYGV